MPDPSAQLHTLDEAAAIMRMGRDKFDREIATELSSHGLHRLGPLLSCDEVEMYANRGKPQSGASPRELRKAINMLALDLAKWKIYGKVWRKLARRYRNNFRDACNQRAAASRVKTVPPCLREFASQLSEFPLCELPSIGPCIYFLFLRKKLVYIGTTINLPSRLSSHHQDKHFDRVLFINVLAGDALKVESKLIKQFRPPLNGTSGRPCAYRKVQHDFYP